MGGVLAGRPLIKLTLGKVCLRSACSAAVYIGLGAFPMAPQFLTPNKKLPGKGSWNHCVRLEQCGVFACRLTTPSKLIASVSVVHSGEL